MDAKQQRLDPVEGQLRHLRDGVRQLEADRQSPAPDPLGAALDLRPKSEQVGLPRVPVPDS